MTHWTRRLGSIAAPSLALLCFSQAAAAPAAGSILDAATYEKINAKARPLPADYDFGSKTITFRKGGLYGPSTQPLPCDIRFERDIPVTLRDGTVIYTDALRPEGDAAPLPAIIAWSPYGKKIPADGLLPGVDPASVSGLMKGEGPDPGFWVCRGYVLLHPDVRGTNKSGGDIQAWSSVDARDGYDFIEWAARQPWSNGKVGLHGTSWLAMAQWAIAAEQPPHLAAIAPWNGISDFYRQSINWGGIPDTAFTTWAYNMLTGERRVERPDEAFKLFPFAGAYWDDKAADLSKVIVPLYAAADVTTELHRLGTFEGFRKAASKQKWFRINGKQEWPDQYDPENEEDLGRFFDHFLKGAANGWEKTPRVRATITDPGGSDRVNVPYTAWPIPETRYTRLYLDVEGKGLSSSPPARDTLAAYPATTGELRFIHRFARETQVTGYLKLRIWVEVKDADDMDLFVLVSKHDAAGELKIPFEAFARRYPQLVPGPGTSGRLRVSMRELDPERSTDYLPMPLLRRPQKLTQGQIVPVDVMILPTSVVFHPGEQLHLSISGHQTLSATLPKTPAAEGSIPTGAVPTLNRGTHIVHAGGKYASYLQLPVVESRTR